MDLPHTHRLRRRRLRQRASVFVSPFGHSIALAGPESAFIRAVLFQQACDTRPDSRFEHRYREVQSRG